MTTVVPRRLVAASRSCELRRPQHTKKFRIKTEILVDNGVAIPSHNTNLTDIGGCCIWYNEKQLLTDVEEHLGITIDQIQNDMHVPLNEFDGKVTYGEKHKGGNVSRGHASEILPALNELKNMEKLIQGSFLDLGYRRPAKLEAW